MVEPPRLLEGDDDRAGSGLTRLLISSAQSETPDERAVRRTLTSLGISGVALGTVAASAVLASAKTGAAATSATSTAIATNGALTGGAMVTSTVAAGGVGTVGTGAAGTGAVVGSAALASKALVAVSVAKWVGVTVVGSAMALGAAHQLGIFEARRDAPAETTSLIVGNAPPHLESKAAATKRPSEPALPLSSEAPELAPVVDGMSAPVGSASRGVVTMKRDATSQPPHESMTEPRHAAGQIGSIHQESSRLAKEVEALDRAREAFSALQFNRTLMEVQSYFAAFPRGYLVPEALFLKMEALERSGRLDEAKVTASRLLSAAPGAPQGARARQLIANRP